MKIHSNDVVRASAGQEIGNERSSLSNPLAVPDLGLESWGLGGRLSRDAIDDGTAIGTMLVVEVAILIRL
jgi:hypothetical protein